MKVREQLLRLIDARGISDRRLSMRATGSTDTIRNIRRGSNPRIDTLEAICDALDVEVHVSPARDATGLEKDTPPEATAPPRRAEALRTEHHRVARDLMDGNALAAPGTSSEIRHLARARLVAVRRLQTAAGGGARDLDEEVKRYAYFRHEWLSRHRLVAVRCSIIGVMGESMEPTLPDGCVILLDHNRTYRREGGIFVVRTADGLVVKRAGKAVGGLWQLVSDHPHWPDAPWPDDATIIGEVKWMARELGLARSSPSGSC